MFIFRRRKGTPDVIVFILILCTFVYTIRNRRNSNDVSNRQWTTKPPTGVSIVASKSGRTLSARNQIRLKSLTSYYEEVLELESFYQPVSNKTMIYACHWKCNGWGDRIRGVMSVYILALLTRRRFMIDMTFPCPVTSALEPNLVNWTYTNVSSLTKGNRSKLVLDSMTFRGNSSTEEIKNTITKDDFVSLWSQYDDVVFYTNGYYITRALKNPYINASTLIGRLPIRLASQQRLFPFLYEILFRPTQSVLNRIDSLLRIPHDKLICLHMRLGRNPTNPLDDEFPFRSTMPEKMIEFLRQRPDLVESTKNLIFVTSDSDQAIELVKRTFPGKTIALPGRVMHVDHFLSRKNLTMSLEERCEGFIKAIADFYMLGECDLSILSESGFSGWASRRRFNPNKDVYVFDDATGSIQNLRL